MAEQPQYVQPCDSVEQLTEWRQQHNDEHREVDKQLGAHEHRLKTTEERLATGASTFEDLRKAQTVATEELRKAVAPKPLNIWQVVLFVLGPLTAIGVLIGGFIWQAAQYPRRDEFHQLQEKVSGVVLDQTKMQVDVGSIRSSVERVERQQDAIEKKLDAVLLYELKKAP